MSQGDQTPPIDAREASMSRVTTLDKLIPAATPASTESEAKTEEKQEEAPKKKGYNERVTELVDRRKAAEAEAEAAKRETAELKAQLEALQVKADPVKTGDKPQRASFQSDDEYVEALADWKATEAIARREREQAEAQARSEFEAQETAWAKRCTAFKSEAEDFESVVGESDIKISDAVAVALKRMEEGPELLYFFAKHPDEAKRISRLHPFDAVRAMDKLASELKGDTKELPKTEPKKSKAPEPIAPVKGVSSADPGPAASFEEYRARRKAEMRR